MKNTLKISILAYVLIQSATAAMAFQTNLQGAWQQVTMQNGAEITRVLLLSDHYFAWTEYATTDGAFLNTKGGRWQLENEQLTFTYEFHTADTGMVGQSEKWLAKIEQGELLLHQNIAGRQLRWEAADQNKTTPLTGAWLMAGRVNNGEIARRDTNVPRKTMKILTGEHFQWIAYNTATKQFFGTGGGLYTAENGLYTERLRFFSRDNNRVGMNLEFKFEVHGNDWHHSGNSSSGEPLYEIWARRER